MEFKSLPKNWKEKSVPVKGTSAEDFRRWAGKPGAIIFDDFCPGQITVIVIDEDGQVFRINDPALTDKIIGETNPFDPFRLISLLNTSTPQPKVAPSLN